MATFTISDHEYMTLPLDTFKQLYIVRRLAPIVGSLVIMSRQLLDKEAAMLPLIEGMGRMSDEDCEFVTHQCLAVTQRKVEGSMTWSPVFSLASKQLMYQDIKLAEMLEITFHVLQENLGDFMPSPRPTDGVGADQ